MATIRYGGIVLKIGVEHYYGILAFFMAILHNIFLLYHVDLFVTVYKIDKTSFWIGEVVFLIWNSVNDPLFGWISDKNYLTSNKQLLDGSSDIVNNRLRLLKLHGPLLAAVFLLLWFPWGYPGIQFVICLCLYDGFLTMIDLHHSALLADLAVSSDARAKLNACSSFFSAAGSFSVFLSYCFWNKDNLDSFRMFCFVLAICSFFGFIIAASKMQVQYRTKYKEISHDWSCGADNESRLETPIGLQDDMSAEKDAEKMMPKQKHTLMTFIAQLKRHNNFKWFVAMNIIQVFHCHFNSNFFPMFLENLLGEMISPWFGSFLIGISFLAPHINNLFFLGLCRKYGSYRVIQLLFAIKLVISVFMFIVGPSSTVFLCLFIASNRVFTEGTCKLLNLVISDLVDEDFVLHNRQRAVSALIFGSTALLSKPGQTFAPLIGMWLLTLLTGHDVFKTGNEVGSMQFDTKNMDPETLSVQRYGCFMLLVYIPIGCAVLQLLVWSQFSLHSHRLSWVKHKRNEATSAII